MCSNHIPSRPQQTDHLHPSGGAGGSGAGRHRAPSSVPRAAMGRVAAGGRALLTACGCGRASPSRAVQQRRYHRGGGGLPVGTAASPALPAPILCVHGVGVGGSQHHCLVVPWGDGGWGGTARHSGGAEGVPPPQHPILPSLSKRRVSERQAEAEPALLIRFLNQRGLLLTGQHCQTQSTWLLFGASSCRHGAGVSADKRPQLSQTPPREAPSPSHQLPISLHVCTEPTDSGVSRGKGQTSRKAPTPKTPCAHRAAPQHRSHPKAQRPQPLPGAVLGEGMRSSPRPTASRWHPALQQMATEPFPAAPPAPVPSCCQRSALCHPQRRGSGTVTASHPSALISRP